MLLLYTTTSLTAIGCVEIFSTWLSKHVCVCVWVNISAAMTKTWCKGMSQKSHGKIRITKCQKTGFGILVEGLRGGTVSPTSNINFFRSQTEKDHLNIFLGGEKKQGSLKSLLWCPIKQTHSTQIPPSLQPRADSGHVGCKCPPGQREAL